MRHLHVTEISDDAGQTTSDFTLVADVDVDLVVSENSVHFCAERKDSILARKPPIRLSVDETVALISGAKISHHS